MRFCKNVAECSRYLAQLSTILSHHCIKYTLWLKIKISFVCVLLKVSQQEKSASILKSCQILNMEAPTVRLGRLHEKRGIGTETERRQLSRQSCKNYYCLGLCQSKNILGQKHSTIMQIEEIVNYDALATSPT